MAFAMDQLAIRFCTFGCLSPHSKVEAPTSSCSSLNLCSKRPPPLQLWLQQRGSRLPMAACNCSTTRVFCNSRMETATHWDTSWPCPRSYLSSEAQPLSGLDRHRNEEDRFRSRAWREGANAEDLDAHSPRSESGGAFQQSLQGRRFLRGYEGNGGEKPLRRREWESQTGRKVKKKHGERITAILQTLENTPDIDAALESWKGRLKTKEQTILLNEQWRWDRALALFSWLKEQENYKPNVYLYNIMLRTCGRARKWDLVRGLWSEMQMHNVSPTNFTFSTLIDVYAKAGRKAEATFWFESMKERGLQPDEVTMSTLINVYKKFGDLEEGRRLFEGLSEPILEEDPVSESELQSEGYTPRDAMLRTNNCESRNKEITKESMLQDVATREPSCIQERPVQGEEQLGITRNYPVSMESLEGEEALEASPQPKNVNTYNIMMDLYARAGQLGEASKLFGDMVKAGVSPDIVTYNSMIHICGRVGRTQEAKALFNKIGEKGLVPDVATYNTLISMFIKKGEKQMALEYYQKMKEVGLVPDAVTFRTLLRDTVISAADVGSRVDLSKHIASVMEELAAGVGESMHKSEITQTIMLNLYKRSGMRKEALAVARRMWKEDLLTNLVSFNSVLEMSRSVTEAREIFERMQRKGISPDVSTYNRLAGILKKAGLVEEALEQIETADSAGLPLSLHTLTTAASLYGHAGMHEEALEACEALRKSGFTLDTVAYTAMIYAFGNAGRLDEALRVSMEMQSRGVEPDVVTYTTVISVYAKMGLLEGVTRLYKRMKRAGCEPDEITYNAVISSYKDAGREDLAAMVFQERQFARYVSEQSKRDATARPLLTDASDSELEVQPYEA